MIARLLSAVVLVYLAGFIGFAVTLPQPLGAVKTDAVVVLTGGKGRIARGLEVLERGEAREMFVSGVDFEVKPGEFAAEFEVPDAVMRCCVTLGYLAVDTRSNAGEAAQWIADNRHRSVRLVTTDWHMARAASEFEGTLPAGTRVEQDAVASSPPLATLFLEYNKLLAAALSLGLPV
mgnify:FL=1